MFSIKRVLHKAPFMFLLLTLYSCTSNYAPRNWLPSKETFPQDPYGSWLYVEIDTPDEFITYTGEFIGMEDNTVLLLYGPMVHRIDGASVKYAQLKAIADSRKGYTAWTLLGILSSISHGWFLAFTIPAWIIVGTVSSGVETRAGVFIEHDPGRDWWRNMSRFSRFPQGIPSEVNIDSLWFSPRPEPARVEENDE
jgi:hypothetical protein